MKNKKIKLIKEIKIGKDENLNPIYKEEISEIFAEERSIYSNEFYNANVQDLKLEAVLIIYPFEYNEEKIVEYNGNRFNIVRTFQKNLNELELTVGEKIGN